MRIAPNLTMPRLALLTVCAMCACGDDGASPDSSNSGSSGTRGGADSTTTAGIETTPLTSGEASSGGTETTPTTASEDTTEGFDSMAPTSDGTESTESSTSTGEVGATVEVTYMFTTKMAGVPLDCAAVGATLVDVTVNARAAPDDTQYDLPDRDCDDNPIVVGPLPPGNYSISVVAYDQTLWFGSSRVFEVEGEAMQLTVPLEEQPM